MLSPKHKRIRIESKEKLVHSKICFTCENEIEMSKGKQLQQMILHVMGLQLSMLPERSVLRTKI